MNVTTCVLKEYYGKLSVLHVLNTFIWSTVYVSVLGSDGSQESFRLHYYQALGSFQMNYYA